MNAATKRARRIPKPALPVSPAPRPTRGQQKQRLDPDAFYSAIELSAVTGIGRTSIYAILRSAVNRPPYCKRRVTGAEFLRLRAAYYGYTDVA